MKTKTISKIIAGCLSAFSLMGTTSYGMEKKDPYTNTHASMRRAARGFVEPTHQMSVQDWDAAWEIMMPGSSAPIPWTSPPRSGHVSQGFKPSIEPKAKTGKTGDPNLVVTDGPLNYDPISKRYHYGPAPLSKGNGLNIATPMVENDREVTFYLGDEKQDEGK